MRTHLGSPAVVVLVLSAGAGCEAPAPEPPARLFTLEEATVADIEAAFEAGALSCPTLVRMYLDRIAAYDDAGPLLNSIITVNPRALDVARELEVERTAGGARGPLHCIPVLLKDNIDTADMPTTNGTVILRDAMPPDDAYVTRALREAGAIVLGKASLGEFAGGNSYNSVDGRTVNPYHLLRSAGGSSSGSAVAVAANLAVFSGGFRHQHLGARPRLVHRHRRPAAHHRPDQPRRHRPEEPQLRHRRSDGADGDRRRDPADRHSPAPTRPTRTV